ncbi:MAG: hypothetical protein QOG54_2755 [Actinomycetota bacterium]|jgi:UPF0755 protein|nr:hypothetical protein [Actinomycetota bacterium]
MSLTRRGKIVAFLATVALLIAVPAGAGYVYLKSVGFYGSSDPGPVVEIVIPKGAGTETIGKILESKGVIKSSFGFKLATIFGGGVEDVQAGRYQIHTGLTARDALDALTGEGPMSDEFVTVTFPEGSWLTDFADRLDDKTDLSGQKFLDLVTSGEIESGLRPKGIDTLEGLLFPSTYQIIDRDDEVTVAERLVREMEDQAAEIGLEEKAGSLGVTPYEAIIIASMIEGEASIPEDRDKIARVIYNRLDQGIALGIDATILYALGEHKTELSGPDLEIDSPYNTRIVAGLPPTPIGAPGKASLEAAVAPADGDWLYYVLADCDGHHAFSVEYNDFLADKRAYQALDC